MATLIMRIPEKDDGRPRDRPGASDRPRGRPEGAAVPERPRVSERAEPPKSEAGPNADPGLHAEAAPQLEPAVADPGDPDERRERIAERAYFRAERRRFAPGQELEDWLAAEAEVEDELRRDPRA
jgi:hypothetical protein